MRPADISGACRAVALLVAVLNHSPAAAVPMLDQVSDPRSEIRFAEQVSFDQGFEETRVGQSFRPGFDGLLTRVDFLVQRSSGNTGTGVFELFRLDTAGRPVGSPLSSWTLDADAVPTGDFDNVADFTPLVLDTPVLVEADEFLGLTVRRTAFGDARWQTPGGTDNPYPRGSLLQWASGSQTWVGTAVGFFAGWDLGLRTYVDPDLPPPPDIVLDEFSGVGLPSPFPIVATISNPPPLSGENGTPGTIGGYRSISLNAIAPIPANGPAVGEVVVDLDVSRGVLALGSAPGVTPLGGLVYLDDGADPDLDLDLTDHVYLAVDYAGLTADLPIEVSLFNAVNGTPGNESFGQFVLAAGSGTAYFAIGDIDQVRFNAPGPVDLASVDAVVFGFNGETGGTGFELDRLYFTAEMTLLGDYDGSGQVEQGDLDLVLQNWGRVTRGDIPAGWVNARPRAWWIKTNSTACCRTGGVRRRRISTGQRCLSRWRRFWWGCSLPGGTAPDDERG